MSLVKDHRVVVTGRGAIGRAVRDILEHHGAAVETWDVADGDDAGDRCVDVTDPDDVERASVAAFDGMPITGLVTTAGVISYGEVTKLGLGEWRRVLEVNLTGTFLCCRHVADRMIRARVPHGSIVVVSSIGGLHGEPGIAHYCASKFGVIGLSQSLARELGPSGIRVNAVCPGAIDSPMNDDLLREHAAAQGLRPDELTGRVVEDTSLRRLGTPEDVAGAVVFLRSDLAGFVTGESLAVTGGLSV